MRGLPQIHSGPIRRRDRRRPAPPRAAARRAVGCLCACLALLVSACGSASATHAGAGADGALASVQSPPATPALCPATVASTLGEVGERIYDQAASGGDVAEAVGRVQSSEALAAAISSSDARAARAALQALLLKQIVGIEILRGGHVFAAVGSEAALAPVRGSIPHTDASFILSVQADSGYLQVAQRVTGAQILLLSGARRVAGTTAGAAPASVPRSGPVTVAGRSYQAYSLTGAVYPSGPLQIALLVPSASISCSGTVAQARVETLGHVGERIYQEELHSEDVSAALAQLERSAQFQRAVLAANPVATHAAIDSFFKAHIHVVRVRVTIGSRLLVDIGGPYVLAPVPGVLRSGGRVIGHFLMAIQDDAGYLKLAHVFTGAQVLMRVAGRQVKGTLTPGPSSVPARGEVAYGGQTYLAYSFTGEAFPSGALRISLLLAA